MNILVTLDKKYLLPLRVMLKSLFMNNPVESFDIYMVADGFTDEDEKQLEKFCACHGSHLHPITIPEGLFENAPVIRYYSKAMYYRLLAAEFLPEDLDKILYLDPDILVINSVRPLYETDISEHLFAGCMHNGLIAISGYVSKLRLPDYESDLYFNSGVLLMNLEAMRREVNPKDIFAFVEKYKEFLILPDQDVLNGLYGPRILSVDESLWNYDARQFESYRISSQGEKNMDWVVENTAILHFCGKSKPWNKKYRGRFSALYKHYMHLTDLNITHIKA